MRSLQQQLDGMGQEDQPVLLPIGPVGSAGRHPTHKNCACGSERKSLVCDRSGRDQEAKGTASSQRSRRMMS